MVCPGGGIGRHKGLKSLKVTSCRFKSGSGYHNFILIKNTFPSWFIINLILIYELEMLSNSNILITGGTGSFGNKFVEMTFKEFNPNKIIIFSRDEMKQWKMAKKYPNDPELGFLLVTLGIKKDYTGHWMGLII